MITGGGTNVTTVPTTQVFIPPQEVVLASSRPTQVFTPPATATVVRTTHVFAPPARSSTGNLPFTGSNVALGLVAGFALMCGGALILVRRREDELEQALDRQASALEALTRR